MIRPSLTRGLCLATATVMILAGSASASPTLSFTEPAYFTTGYGAWLVTTGDLNRDQRPDLGVANVGALGSNAFTIMLNTTPIDADAPAFAAPTKLPGLSAQSVVFADLDRDGNLDVIGTDQPLPPAGRLRVWRNLTPPGGASLQLAAPLVRTTGTTPEIVVAADMDRDHRLDIVVANFGTLGAKAVTIYRNTTAGPGQLSFAPAQHFTGGAGAEGMAVADLNADGLPEVVTGNTIGNKVAVLRNDSSRGSIELAAPQMFTVNLGPTAVAAGDLNDDGSPDLAIGSSFSGSQSLSTLLNQTTPGASTFTFSTQTDYASDQGAEGILITDLDHDGTGDIVLATYAQQLAYVSGGLTIFRNTTPTDATQLTFDPARRISPGPATVAVAAADFNRDGHPDLASTNFLAPPGRGLYVVLNQTP